MKRTGSFARTHGFDLVIVLTAIGAALDVALRNDAERAPRSPEWFAVPAAASLPLLLLGRRRWPFASPAAVWVLGGAATFVDGRLLTFTAGATITGLAAAFLLGQVPEPGRAGIGLGLVLIGSGLIVANDPNHAFDELIFVPLPFAIAWLAGFAVRERTVEADAANERARAAERERVDAGRIAVAEERARIARELHDVVAHAVSVMVLQAGALRHGLPAGREQEAEALGGIEDTGRTALAEMRHLLGAMRRGEGGPDLAPTPGLGRLEPLLAEVRRAGLDVDVIVDGDPVALPQTLDLAAYRVVQEGITNALKHARASRAEVLLGYGPDELRVEVRDDGRGTAPSDGLGHGLVGARERVTLYGGEMSAGPAEGGGFLLRACFPLEASGT